MEGNPFLGFPSNDRFALCFLSKEHQTMNLRGDTLGGKPFFLIVDSGHVERYYKEERIQSLWKITIEKEATRDEA